MRRMLIGAALSLVLATCGPLCAFAQILGDLDVDGDADGSDLWLFVEDVVRNNCGTDPPCPGDIHPVDRPDGEVGAADVAIFAQDFGLVEGVGLITCGAIGDSIGAATHANDACDRNPGEHRELMDCLELRLGSHDPEWSFMGGSKPWSIAHRLGCDDVYNTSEDGDEWKDALGQARNQIQAGPLRTVMIHLGNNDVCAKYHHDYGSLAFVQPATPDHIVSIEVEHFLERVPSDTHRWEPDRTPGASMHAVIAQPNAGTRIPYPNYLTSAPRLDYRVHFARTGTHHVWIRGYADGSGDNSVHVALDGEPQENAESMIFDGDHEWTWTGSTETGAVARIEVPSAGSHTLNIYMDKDGARLDKIVLVPDQAWSPADWGPAESARGVFKQRAQSAYGIVAIEAEHYQGLQKIGLHTWEPDFEVGHSGAASMMARPDNGAEYKDPASSPRLDYHVNFHTAGTYYVWIRGHATGEDDNSVHVGIDGMTAGTTGNVRFDDYNTWTWSNSTAVGSAATIDIPSPGMHTVNVWMHKDGFRFDKLLLSNNSSYAPSDDGPKEKWENDLGRIAGHIDDTLLYLTENLEKGGHIYWSGIIDIVNFRDFMANRKHDHMFTKCQNLWDLDIRSGTLQGDAKNSLCKKEIGDICTWLPDFLEDELMDQFLSQFQDDFNADTPCGRVLDSRNNREDRNEARRFNKALNDLMEQKADQYQRRRGVSIHFTQNLWYSSAEIRPYLLSRLDCFHPNRLGQLKLAQLWWEGQDPNFKPTDAFYYEGFDSEDWCTQQFTTWDSCWYEGGWGDCGDEFICKIDNSGWFKFGKESSNNEDHWIARDAGDLTGKSEVWAYFKHKRDQFDGDRSDWVRFSVWNGSSWVEVERFHKNNDTGNHCSQYYDLTQYKDAAPFKIQFRTNNSSDMKNGDKLMLDDISIFAW